MTLLGVMSTLLILGSGALAPFLVISVVILWFIACAYVVLQNEHARPLLKEGWTPLLGSMVIASASGIVLDLFVSRYDGYALLAVAFGGAYCNLTLCPSYRCHCVPKCGRSRSPLLSFLGIPGGTGSILVSRLSTAWHVASSTNPRNTAPTFAGAHSSHLRHDEPSPRTVMLVLLLVAIPVGLFYFLFLRVSAWLAASFTFSMLALIFLCIAVRLPKHLTLIVPDDVFFCRSLCHYS